MKKESKKARRSAKKMVQIAAGVIMLLGWGLFGAYGIPTSRLSTLTNYPNPFDSRNQQTTIAYYLNTSAHVTVRIYDLLGYIVRKWEFSPFCDGGDEGLNTISWDGTQEDGRKVASGGYICQVLVEQEDSVIQGVRKIGVIH